MAAQLCSSLLQVPRSRISRLACLWGGRFRNHRRAFGNISYVRIICSQVKNIEGAYGDRWIRRSSTSGAEGRTKSARRSKPSTIQHEMLDESVPCPSKSGFSEVQRIHYFDIQQRIAESKESCKLVTVFTFDIETTGLSRENDRIIEIALQDLQGGKNSTFETLVNPECYIPNSYVHGITNHMVSKPAVPRMKELAPILVEYVASRKNPEGYALLVAHNARTFDVPFLVNEFNRCEVGIPSNWLFLDSLPLARQLLKSEGGKANAKASLPALVEMFNVPRMGTAHRAMADVKSLSIVFQQLTFLLKLSMSSLLEESFTAADVKKKSSR